MATFAPGDDVDGYCGECGQVLGNVILVTIQGSEKSCDLSFGYRRRKNEGSEAGQVRF